ncbi:MAG: hypothetical protein ACRCTR_05685 [Actinomycetota bacterium]
MNFSRRVAVGGILCQIAGITVLLGYALFRLVVGNVNSPRNDSLVLLFGLSTVVALTLLARGLHAGARSASSASVVWYLLLAVVSGTGFWDANQRLIAVMIAIGCALGILFSVCAGLPPSSGSRP